MVYDGTTYYFVKNIFGDVVAICNEYGVVVETYEYDFWGNITSGGTSGIGKENPFRYRGYYYDNETGFYYLQTRYYDPEICRFISADNLELISVLSQSPGLLNLYVYCNNNPVMNTDETGEFPLLSLILGITALVGFGLTIGGIASENNILTAIGLTLVTIPALISGGMAIVAGIGGATFIGIVGGVTAIAGIGSGLFASAEYQEAFTANNWMTNAGLSDRWYHGLMLTTAAIATLGTIASLFCYNFNIKSIDKIGRLNPTNHQNKEYFGIRFTNTRGSLRSLELQNHVPHGLHFQLNSWNPKHMSVKTIMRWTWFLTRM